MKEERKEGRKERKFKEGGKGNLEKEGGREGKLKKERKKVGN